jgi:hypothetical protein
VCHFSVSIIFSFRHLHRSRFFPSDFHADGKFLTFTLYEVDFFYTHHDRGRKNFTFKVHVLEKNRFLNTCSRKKIFLIPRGLIRGRMRGRMGAPEMDFLLPKGKDLKSLTFDITVLATNIFLFGFIFLDFFRGQIFENNLFCAFATFVFDIHYKSSDFSYWSFTA